MGNPMEIETPFFALKSTSSGTEVIFLNQNLAIRLASIVRDFDADLLGALPGR
jgi:hypothetical protein